MGVAESYMVSGFIQKRLFLFAVLMMAANALMGQFYLTGEDP